jgi:hypothetical protein
VQRGPIAFGKDRNGANLHLAARTRDPHGDLAAVGDQDLFQLQD